MLRILYGCGGSSGRSRIAESGPALFFFAGLDIADTAVDMIEASCFTWNSLLSAVLFIRCGFERLCKLADFSTLGITCGKTPPADCCFTWNINYFLCRQRRLWAIITECFTWNKYLHFDAAGGWGKRIRCAPFYRIRFESVSGLYVSRETIIESCTEIKAIRLVFYALYYAVSFTLLLRFRYRFL